MVEDMWMIIFIVFLSGFFPLQSEAQTSTSASEGDAVTLKCSLSGTFTFPVWQGPPSLATYTLQDDTSGAINPIAPAASRLEYASNNKDLILTDAQISDSGEYKCTYPSLGSHTITLTVTKIATTTSTTPTSTRTMPTFASATPTTTSTTPTKASTTPTNTSSMPTTTSTMPTTNISTTASSTTTVDNSSDSKLAVIIISSVGGGLLVVGIAIAALFIYYRQRNKKHTKRNQSHLGRDHRKQYKTSKSPYQQNNDYHLYNGRTHNVRSQVKENHLNRVSKEKRLSRSYYTGASSRYDNYRPAYTMEHVYPSSTSGHIFMSEYIAENRNPKNPKHSSYPGYSMGNMRYTDNKIFYY